MTQVHSVLARAGPAPCATAVRPAAPWLRPYVAGYAGFRTGGSASEPLARRVLPLNLATVIIDVDAPVRLVTGPRATPLVDGRTAWRHGITLGLTPAGVAALAGMPIRELTGAMVPLDAVLGTRGGELAERMAAAPGWAARFALLDDQLTAWLCPERTVHGPVERAWWRLQETGGRIPIGRLVAELDVGRRGLEAGFRREIGLTPKTVARIARFQRAARVLSSRAEPLEEAVACGYADQPHFTREVRAMAGVTPTRLCAFLQDTEPLAG